MTNISNKIDFIGRSKLFDHDTFQQVGSISNGI